MNQFSPLEDEAFKKEFDKADRQAAGEVAKDAVGVLLAAIAIRDTLALEVKGQLDGGALVQIYAALDQMLARTASGTPQAGRLAKCVDQLLEATRENLRDRPSDEVLQGLGELTPEHPFVNPAETLS